MICLNIDSEISPIPPLISTRGKKVQNLAFKGE